MNTQKKNSERIFRFSPPCSGNVFEKLIIAMSTCPYPKPDKPSPSEHNFTYKVNFNIIVPFNHLASNKIF